MQSLSKRALSERRFGKICYAIVQLRNNFKGKYMSDEEEIRKFREFMDSDHDCKCMDGSFEEFDKCCGKKFGLVDPINRLFKMVANISQKSTVPRLTDMEPEQAQKTLEKIFKS